MQAVVGDARKADPQNFLQLAYELEKSLQNVEVMRNFSFWSQYVALGFHELILKSFFFIYNCFGDYSKAI